MPNSSNAARLDHVNINFRVLFLSVFLTAILAASNVYLALKIGHTIAASIPAAVISMAILHFFKNSQILESNLVQTSASAGEGVAAAVSFILPALIITGYWQHFYYWQTFCIVFIGGMLGLFFSIPLRKILLHHRDLSFPEGTAIGQVMKVSINSKKQFQHLLTGGLLGAIISLSQIGFKWVAENWQLWFRKDHLLFGTALGFSPALLAAGFIVGIEASIAMLFGWMIGWIIGIPVFSLFYALPSGLTPYELTMQLWNNHIRFIGVGTMIIGGIWTLIKLVKPIINGLKVSLISISSIKLRQNRSSAEEDFPFILVLIGIFIFSLFSVLSYAYFLSLQPPPFSFLVSFLLSSIATLVTLVAGFFLASICAYLSGLVGMTNNPLSGLMLIAVLIIASLLSLTFMNTPTFLAKEMTLVILITSVIAVISAISGENIQDLKAGQLLNAKPWKQQLMIMLGVTISALVVAPVLEILFQAYGIGGVFPLPHMNKTQMLPAPQAGLITAIAQGVFKHNLPKREIILGGLIAIAGIIGDEYLKYKRKRLPVLAIGLGIYLPPDIVLPVIIGGFTNYLASKRKKPHNKEQISALLLACGIVAGSALTGVFLAIPFILAGNSDALNLLPNSFRPFTPFIGLIITGYLCLKLYKTT